MKEIKEIFRKHEIKLMASLAVILFVGLVASIILAPREVKEPKQASAEEHVSKVAFDEVSIKAQAAYVYDLRSGQALFEKNADRRLPLASLTKVMSALVAEKASAKDEEIVIDRRALALEGDSGLKPGQKWSLKTLLDYSLVSSSNDGMAAIALAVEKTDKGFVGEMNRTADELGMKNTYYFNETGLDQSATTSGAYGTARDIATLFSYIIQKYPVLLDATTKKEIAGRTLDGEAYLAKNTDGIVTEIPGIIASKTGYTALAGGNLAIAFDPEVGRPIIIVVLGSTEEGRFQDVQRLMAATLQSLNSK